VQSIFHRLNEGFASYVEYIIAEKVGETQKEEGKSVSSLKNSNFRFCPTGGFWSNSQWKTCIR
jgi:hypothetical protein